MALDEQHLWWPEGELVLDECGQRCMVGEKVLDGQKVRGTSSPPSG